MSDPNFRFKKEFIRLLQDPVLWSEFSSDWERAKRLLIEWGAKSDLSKESVVALVYIVAVFRQKVSELQYEWLNTVIHGDILIFDPWLKDKMGSMPIADFGPALAATGTVKDGPKLLFESAPQFNFAFEMADYLVQACRGTIATLLPNAEH